jgi:uncharacterized protein YjbI with pentapeptide repeats
MGTGDVTFWEWMGVLIIPVALLAVGLWLDNAQARRAETASNQRAQDEALQAYLSEMSNLVVQHGLRTKSKDSDVRKIAQARTIAVLLELDPGRKRRALKLVYELGLINKDRPILDLHNAGLHEAALRELALPNACLKHVDLRAADLSGSNLSGSDLSEADLRGANLTNVDLSGVDLTDANLLPYDELQPAKLSIHNLKDNAPDSSEAILRFPKIKPNLTPTNLSNTNLDGTELRGVILANTDLRNVRGLYKTQQLEQAIGNRATQLPSDVKPPESWKKPIEKQIEMRDKRKDERKAITPPKVRGTSVVGIARSLASTIFLRSSSE